MKEELNSLVVNITTILTEPEEEAEAAEEAVVLLKEIKVVHTNDLKEKEEEGDEVVEVLIDQTKPLRENREPIMARVLTVREDEDVVATVDVVGSVGVVEEEVVERELLSFTLKHNSTLLPLQNQHPELVLSNNQILLILTNVLNTLMTLVREAEEEDVEDVEDVVVSTEKDMNHPSMTLFNLLLKRENKAKDPRAQLSSEVDVERDNMNVILALEDQLLGNINAPGVVEETGERLAPRPKKLSRIEQEMNLSLLKNPLMPMNKKRMSSLQQKNPRLLILLNGKNNNRRRKLPYKKKLNKNRKKSERQMMGITLPSRISLSTTRRRKNPLPRQLPKRRRKSLRKRRLSH